MEIQTSLKQFQMRIRKKWNSARKKRPERERPYLRYCKRCSKIFETKVKGSKICKECYKRPYGNIQKVKG